MVSKLRGGAIVRLCPSYINYIIYSVIITLYLYSAISFSSMHIPSFLLILSLPSSITPSLRLSSHLVSSLPLFLLSPIPRLVDSQYTFICHMLILKVAKLGKVPKYNLTNTIYKIVKLTLFTRYRFMIQRHIFYFSQ